MIVRTLMIFMKIMNVMPIIHVAIIHDGFPIILTMLIEFVATLIVAVKMWGLQIASVIYMWQIFHLI